MTGLMLAALGWSDYTVLAVYGLVIISAGTLLSRGNRDTERYLLGGRAMPWWVIAVAYVVSLLSTLTLVGVPGEAYNHGITMALGTLMLPVCSIIAFHIFVRFYFVSRVFTPFDYLERRFGPGLRAIAAGFFWLSRLIYLSLVLYASAKVFTGAANWPVWLTILLVGGVGTAYTVAGGLTTVVWVNFIQFFVLVGGITVIVLCALAGTEGPVAAVRYAVEHGRGAPHLFDPAFYHLDPFARVTFWTLAIAIFNEQLFFNSSDQIALQRLLATSSYRQARRSIFGSAAILLPVLSALWFLGLVIFTFYDQRPGERPASGDLALFHFIATQLPSPLPGLILAAMIAAVMCTLGSGMNSLATVAAKDFYLRFFRRDADERRQVRFSRVVTLVIGVLAMLIGLTLSKLSDNVGATVLETTMAWLALSVALPPVFLLGMLSRRATMREAVAALVTGWGVTAGMLVWYLASQNNPGGGLSFMAVGVPGPAVALLVGWGLSRLRPRLPDERLANLTYRTLTRQ